MSNWTSNSHQLLIDVLKVLDISGFISHLKKLSRGFDSDWLRIKKLLYSSFNGKNTWCRVIMIYLARKFKFKMNNIWRFFKMALIILIDPNLIKNFINFIILLIIINIFLMLLMQKCSTYKSGLILALWKEEEDFRGWAGVKGARGYVYWKIEVGMSREKQSREENSSL